ncbi:uncharacterized protein LOC143233042 [Tachypleus tridentatus]|uniref:uncharacterized protein LOC143233042 n=1 Tax=Tachypleus tridentatus TaxID=6853 RepID=UPI003FD1ECDF
MILEMEWLFYGDRLRAHDIFSHQKRMISGTRKKHWQLLLEEKKSGFLWPGDSEAETKKEALSEKRTVFGGERSSDEKQLDPRPQHLSQYDDRVFLAPQHARGRQLLTVHNPSSNILQVYESYFESPLLFSYRLPSDCGNIILADKLLFLTLPDNLGENTPRHKLKILSCQLSEVSGEGAKRLQRDKALFFFIKLPINCFREAYEAEVQAFSFPGEIISSHKKSSSVTCTDNLVKQLSDLSCHYDFPDDVTVKFATVTKSGKGIPRPSNINLKKNSHHFHKTENESGLKKDRERLSVVGKRKHSTLEKCFILENLISGFYIVTKHCVFECRPRVTPEKLFLSLTTSPADLPRAEHLGVMLSLDISYLYEVAADLQLANGQFAQAVRLYQLSKCPQLKRVANFISYGYLSELLAYVQVLFTTTITEVQAPDRVHFGNLAVHCFVQQILEKTGEKLAVVHAFRVAHLPTNLEVINECKCGKGAGYNQGC